MNMNSPSKLFSPVRLGPLELPNRIMISPMCQYSALEGNPVAWHFVHLGSLAISGAGLLCLEATAVSPEGRITPGCLGLYNDTNQAELARLAFAQFGKGRHRASLNFGDCFPYALAKWLGQPLLFKGDDFSHTDLVAVTASATQL